jgi:hypothetical protein
MAYPLIDGIPRMLLGEHRTTFLSRNWHRLARRAAEVCVTECPSAVKYERYQLTAWAYSMHYEELHQQL